MRRILDSIDAELTPWRPLGGRSRCFRSCDGGQRVRQSFPRAFDRWRQLYERRASAADRGQPKVGDARPLAQPSARKRKSSKRRRTSSSRLLERGTRAAARTSTRTAILRPKDSCPGYNFPRLPLYALCRRRLAGPKAAYLQRARFLAIAEFGPRSLIYHEGRAYRVHKAKLPPGLRTRKGPACDRDALCLRRIAAPRTSEEPERCHACGAPWAASIRSANMLRIDNVETQPAERITANDEDRQRQGFEIQTVFAWPTPRWSARRAIQRSPAMPTARSFASTMRRAQRSVGSTRG